MARDGKYGNIICEKTALLPDEPVFLLRGKDLLVPQAIRMYANRCKQAGCDPKHIDACLVRAAEIEQWQKENPTLVKAKPD